MDYTSDNNKVAGCVAENIEDINLNRSTTYTLRPKTVGDVTNGFKENLETGKVVGFGGLLDIRPEYQREFVYGPAAQQAVIETVLNGAPLSNLYWVKNADGSFECLDGFVSAIKMIDHTFSRLCSLSVQYRILCCCGSFPSIYSIRVK